MSATAEQRARSWPELAAWADWPEGEALAEQRIHGPTNAQASLRLFGGVAADVRVTLYRDHHAWCPYCQKIWLWLEERRIPYRIRKVTMFCYGSKEPWFTRLVPSGMLPALELDGRLITESDRILAALEQTFGPLGPRAFDDGVVLQLRQLERLLFRAWCQWLCTPGLDAAAELRCRVQFQRYAAAMEEALAAAPGAFLLGDEPATADLVFVPYLERMNASLAYYKGFDLRQQHPGIDRWFRALEQRPTYLGTQSDFHTHAHDLPPQMGGCWADGSDPQRRWAARIDGGPWPIASPDPETSAPAPVTAAREAVARVARHGPVLLARMAAATGLEVTVLDTALRTALERLVSGAELAPPPGTGAGLAYLRDRISVPRDMGLHAARLLRAALDATAHLDALDRAAAGPPLPQQHRRDQDPAPFVAAA